MQRLQRFFSQKFILKDMLKYTLSFIFLFLAYSFFYDINLEKAQPFNIDGILYLQAADMYLSHGFQATLATYPWPLYSILLATFSHWLQLPPLTIAHGFGFICGFGLITGFILLNKQMGAQKIRLWLAALLLLTLPQFNHFHANIMRDSAYYFLSLWSFAALIAFANRPHWSFAFLWSGLNIFATLFRIEGIAFGLLLPLSFLLFNELTLLTRIKQLLSCYALLFFMLVVFFGYIWINKKIDLEHLGRIADMVNHGLNSVSMIHERFQWYRQQLLPALNPFAQKDINIFLVSGLLGIYAATLANTLSLLLFFCSIFALLKVRNLNDLNRPRTIIYAALLINLLIILIFLGENYFLSRRYVLLQGLLLLPFIPIFIENFNRVTVLKKSRWSVIFVGTLSAALLFNTVDSLKHFGTSKTYIVKAGTWLKRNMTAHSQLYSNDLQLLYYAGTFDHPQNSPQLKNLLHTIQKNTAINSQLFPTIFQQLKQAEELGILNLAYLNHVQALQDYSILAVKLTASSPSWETQFADIRSQLKVLKIFQNRKGDLMVILQVLKSLPSESKKYQHFPVDKRAPILSQSRSKKYTLYRILQEVDMCKTETYLQSV